MNLVAEEKGNQGVFVSLAYSVVFFSSEKKSVWGVHSHNFPWARGREKTFLVSSILANLRNTFWGFWPWLAKSFCFQLNSVFSWWLCLSLWAPNMELGQRVFLRDFWALCPKRPENSSSGEYTLFTRLGILLRRAAFELAMWKWLLFLAGNEFIPTLASGCSHITRSKLWSLGNFGCLISIDACKMKGFVCASPPLLHLGTRGTLVSDSQALFFKFPQGSGGRNNCIFKQIFHNS